MWPLVPQLQVRPAGRSDLTCLIGLHPMVAAIHHIFIYIYIFVMSRGLLVRLSSYDSIFTPTPS